jgi:flagellar hook-associated protein 3 FlgL
MRITPGMTADNAVYNLQQGRSVLDSLQEQVSSGSIVNRPSDNPLTTRQLLDLKNQISAGDQYSSNITKGTLLLNVTDTALGGMSALMQQIQKTAATMVSGSSDPTAIAGATGNLAQLKSQLIDLGNTQIGNQYVFAGFKNSPPFDATLTALPATTPPVQVASNLFSGTDDDLKIEVTQGSQVATNVSGGRLLRGGSIPPAVGSGATAGGSPVDILGSIDALIQAISSNNTAGIADGIKNMKAAADQITASQTDVAGRLIRLSNTQSMIANNQNTLKSIYGDKQNVDYAKAGVELSQQTTAFNAALSTTAKISQLSLLDYMK